jgi:hypothetical protein
LYVALEVTVMSAKKQAKPARNALALAVALGLFPRGRRQSKDSKRAKDAKHHWSRDQW